MKRTVELWRYSSGEKIKSMDKYYSRAFFDQISLMGYRRARMKCPEQGTIEHARGNEEVALDYAKGM